jgi:hypothetical protein
MGTTMLITSNQLGIEPPIRRRRIVPHKIYAAVMAQLTVIIKWDNIL